MHETWIRHTLELAIRAKEAGEVPIGAVIVLNNEIIGEGWNCPISSHDPTAHAEINALRQAGQKINNYRLTGTTLYVTLEPCIMCLGAMVQARIANLIFGAYDSRVGSVESLFKSGEKIGPNHRFNVLGGILEQECGQILKGFFSNKRD